MAFELHREVFPGIAASVVQPRQLVKLVDGERRVAPIASTNELPLGLALGSAGIGENVAVPEPGSIVKAIAGASLGGGAEVQIGSSNGALVLAAGASGVTKFSVGQTVAATAAGEVVSVRVNPRQLSNLI